MNKRIKKKKSLLRDPEYDEMERLLIEGVDYFIKCTEMAFNDEGFQIFVEDVKNSKD